MEINKDNHNYYGLIAILQMNFSILHQRHQWVNFKIKSFHTQHVIFQRKNIQANSDHQLPILTSVFFKKRNTFNLNIANE